MKNRVLTVLGWAVLVATSLFFVMAGTQKLLGNEQMAAVFDELGYAAWFRIAIGLAEIAIAVLLLVPRTSLLAASGLALLMIGAVVSELRLGNGWQALVPGQWLLVSAWIVVVKLRRRRSAGRKTADAGMS